MGQPHALIVEDNNKNMVVLATLLHKEGFTHTDVLDPLQVADTLDILEQIDIVFLDLEMPGMDGFGVLKLLKADERFSAVPVVAYTVHVSEFNSTYKTGFHSFIAKPVDPDRFPDQVARILRGEHVWDRV